MFLIVKKNSGDSVIINTDHILMIDITTSGFSVKLDNEANIDITLSSAETLLEQLEC